MKTFRLKTQNKCPGQKRMPLAALAVRLATQDHFLWLLTSLAGVHQIMSGVYLGFSFNIKIYLLSSFISELEYFYFILCFINTEEQTYA